MRRSFRKPAAVTTLAVFLALTLGIIPILAAPVEKDVAAGDENSYLYGANADETLVFTSTATGDVNNDGLPDLIMGHDQGGTALPYLYTGKVYVYYGRTNIAPDVDLGTGADVTINGVFASFTGNSVACGDVNGDNIDDIIIGAYLDNPGGNIVAGGVAVIFGSTTLPATWDFNVTQPDLYLSSANAGELCGMSVTSGDIDGDGFNDIIFGAPLGNGGVHFNDGSDWSAQGRANGDSLTDVSMYSTSNGWAVGKYVSVYTTLYFYDGTSWSTKTAGLPNLARDFYGVSAYDATHVWAVGEQGTVAFWNNTTWATQTSGVTTPLRDVAALDANNVWAVGDGGIIRKTADGGTNWGAQASGTTADLRGITVVDANNAWAVGDGGTILYFNGTSWGTQPSGTTADLRGVAAADASNVWAVGDGGNIRYFNGATWGDQNTGTANLRGVSAASTTTAWAVGDGGTILKTADGGTTWSPESALVSQQINAVDAYDATNVWAVGEAAAGRAYVVWGRDNAGWLSLTWSYNNPIRPDRVINGIDAFDYCGVPVSAGNLNGDIRDDLVIGSFEANGPGNARSGCGEAYVVNGRARGSFPNPLNLSTGSNCTIYGSSILDRIPTSFSQPLENVNGDQYDDIVLGTIWADGPDNTRPGCGEVYVIYGGNLPATYDMATRAPDIMLYGPASGAGAGRDVDVLDFDADGFQDIATGGVGASKGTGRPNCGAAWLMGGSASWASQVDLATQAGMVFYGPESNDGFGVSLTSANLNGDSGGFDDLVISDLNGDGPGNTRPNCGEHFIFLGYDYVSPTCSITNVADGSVLAGVVGVTVEASDHYGIDRVEFRVDGELTHTDTTAPYRWDWDTREYVDGATYTLQARAYDNSGNSTSDSRDVKINNTIPPVATTWYLAEGTTAWGFEEYVLVQNPNPTPVGVTFTFMKPGGDTQTAGFTIEENSRFTILVNSFVSESDVSTRVTGSQPIICERAMYWTPQGQTSRIGGHDSIGVTNTSPTWYLAEGTTAFGFEEYILVQNPNAGPVDVTMTFMKPGGVTQALSFPIAAQARYTVNVNEVVPESDVSTRVEATGPVICERSMYRNNKDLGHDSIGTPSTSREWYLAEGTTAWGFDEYVLIQNPGTQQAAISLEFMLPDGSVIPYGVLVPGESRHTIHVDEVPGCEETDLSTFVTSNVPVICERAMYWQGATSAGGHDTIGTPLPSTAWYLAEGTTAWGFEEYVLVQNPNDTEAVVSFTFMKPDATTEFVSFPVAGNSRFSLRANDVVPDSDISVSVLSDKPVICERSMYWGQRNVGHVTIGVRGD